MNLKLGYEVNNDMIKQNKNKIKKNNKKNMRAKKKNKSKVNIYLDNIYNKLKYDLI